MDESLKKIIETAANLYQKFGIKSVTMDDVAHECMISKKTLYKYVNDKIDLLQKTIKFEFLKYGKVFKEISDRGLNAVEEVVEIHKILTKMLKIYNPATEYDLLKYYPVVHREFSEQKAMQVYEMMKTNLQKGIDEGLYCKDINIELVAKQRVIFQVQKIENSVVSYKEFMKPKAVKYMLLYHMRAICTPKGLEMFKNKIKDSE